MLLAIDIGNTNIVFGLYQAKKLITHWRLATQAERTADEYGVIISQLIGYAGFGCPQISAIAVSCVVPPMLTMTQELGQKFFNIDELDEFLTLEGLRIIHERNSLQEVRARAQT